nr:hypothetical protein [Tanacetum cinerariifolium]
MFLNYALMIRQDYDLTSSLRRGALQYEQKMVQNLDKPDDPEAKIIEPLNKMTESNKKQYLLDMRVYHIDPYVENKSGADEHDLNAHDQSITPESVIQNVQTEAKNQRRLNNELKKQKALLQKELETCKEHVKTLEKQPVKS